MMRIFDTHAHYDSEQFEADRAALLGGTDRELDAGGRDADDWPGGAGEGNREKECAVEASGENEARDWQVAHIVNVGATFAGAAASLALAHEYEKVYVACGIHPDEVGELEEEPEKFAALERMCADEKCVAVGEIGLDYHWMVQPKELQQKWFIRQMELSERAHLPINVHSRDAAADTFDLVKAHHAATGEGGIIHCYSGSPEMAREYVKLGYHIGVGGVVTFKNGRVLKEVVRDIPIEWLVTETDCPYLAPTPFRGQRNDSRYIRYVIETIARLKEMETERAARILYENACRVYKIG